MAYPNFTGPGGGTLNLDGSVHVTSSSSIQSANVLLKRLIHVDLLHDHRMFLVGGYRWFRTEEGIQIQDDINAVGGGLPAGAGFQHLDSFGVKNNFNGGDIGLFSDMRKGRWVLETTGKIAVGNMNEIVNIDGFTRVRTGTTSTDYAGGVLTQPSNMGVYRHNQFSMIPELNLKLGYQITHGLAGDGGLQLHLHHTPRAAGERDRLRRQSAVHARRAASRGPADVPEQPDRHVAARLHHRPGIPLVVTPALDHLSRLRRKPKIGCHWWLATSVSHRVSIGGRAGTSHQWHTATRSLGFEAAI